jgi:hypothetical protein
VARGEAYGEAVVASDEWLVASGGKRKRPEARSVEKGKREGGKVGSRQFSVVRGKER